MRACVGATRMQHLFKVMSPPCARPVLCVRGLVKGMGDGDDGVAGGVGGGGRREGDSEGRDGGLAGDSLGISGGLAPFFGDSLRKTECFPRASGGLVRDHARLL